MRGATQVGPPGPYHPIISIHAPHAGSDSIGVLKDTARRYFNPRSPCGERHMPPYYVLAYIIFQSTLPMRGATRLDSDDDTETIFQSTLPMRGATRQQSQIQSRRRISIHAPHAGSDARKLVYRYTDPRFQSTLPMRGATLPNGDYTHVSAISIHAPHAGSDKRVVACFSFYAIFQSTLPMRGATKCNIRPSFNVRFQSTLPMRGATHFSRPGIGFPGISIHAPHAGSDPTVCHIGISGRSFQSTLPMRGATFCFFLTPSDELFQSTLPMRGATHVMIVGDVKS